MSNHPDVHNKNLTRSGHSTIQENIDPDSVHVEHQRDTALSLTSTSILEVTSDQQNYTIGNGSVPLRVSSVPSERTSIREMSLPLNERLLLSHDVDESSFDYMATNTVACLPSRDPSTSESKIEHSDGETTFQYHQNTSVLVAEFNSTNNLRYSGDSVRPPAPSSVKSYGSNLGSDDCGGSLDVETHSDGARSIDDTFSVAILDQDPETVAVASLSINPTEKIECNRFPDTGRYNNLGHLTPLTLQCFHRESASSQLDDDHEGKTVYPQESHDESVSWLVAEAIGRTHSNWNDPRVDGQSSHERRNSSRMASPCIEDQTRPRRRSRSRTPPTEH